MPLYLRERLANCIGVLSFILSAGPFVLRHILSGLRTSQDRGFAEFWSTNAPQINTYESTTAVPALVSSAYGTVLELGPAQGNQLPRFTLPQIKHIYGLEPNPFFHPALHTAIHSIPTLQNLYTPLLGSIENSSLLELHGLAMSSCDCVLSIQVLCSVADPFAVARQLYALLKPGGRLIVWEHQASHDGISRGLQAALNFLWTPVVGGCRLDSPVEAAIREAGEWERIELQTGDTQPWSLMPRVWGHLVKKVV